MKKLLCCLLALGLMLCAVPALGEVALYEMWSEHCWNEPGYGGNKKEVTASSDRRVEGNPVGGITDWMMDYEISQYSGDLKDMIIAWNRSTDAMEQPFFDALEERMDDVEIKIIDSEFYTFREDGMDVGEAELYLLDIRVGTPSGREMYTVLVCLQLGDYTIEAAEYVLISGNPGALGVVGKVAALNGLGEMEVVNCEEWVSLREGPSTKAERLMKVPLGARVSDAYHTDNGFVRCVYQGCEGFILWDYLETTAWLDYLASK